MSYELFFSDLNPEAQQEYLKVMGLSRPEDANLDVFPLAVIEAPKPELQTLKIYSPITLDLVADEESLDPDDYMYDYEIAPVTLDGKDALQYKDSIRDAIKSEITPDMEKRGLMEYYHCFDSMSDRVKYAYPTIEEYMGELWCVTECRITEPLNSMEIDQLKRYLTGQYSDGFGEGLEQREKQTVDGPILIHLWQSDSKYTMLIERELKGQDKQRNQPKKSPTHKAR